MARLRGTVETCLYVDDLERAAAFYSDVLGMRAMTGDERFRALEIAPGHVLLLFVRGGTLEPVDTGNGIIPPHDGGGPVHVGFAIDLADLVEWERRLAEHRVPLESRVARPRGGRSIYFRDPDGHLVELLTPGVWPNY
ncbi:MAG TPA: VOC family protein [Candidatus Sumerlaeota bacterium]|nr:MAG: fosfomycin resistance protein FosB [candidate division BRC1 bacterium ADurb.BinA292]HOE96051.1 VOC family protein [Candidatus Sumerlaeota bacterium]HOR27883.1 VOC family protein [Candidatus Sumerlaeota bacterium]HPK01980.1 VOC family protein [Candidatus Sumerlaeota bacterium]